MRAFHRFLSRNTRWLSAVGLGVAGMVVVILLAQAPPKTDSSLPSKTRPMLLFPISRH
jgi:hypothetical protein